ncbi:PIG-L deacetylase family protein [Dyella acidiphila]|uniref:PIG-L family deacetylase n=1 Tax=Dyella acidiphila TaxID=2775866 RepID=A0ABR9GC09_9GAMM|nr:PIG-L deacetylase family protein [Dyella acidiphila]MBE1161558.1 PIG-L family deacetylase [Dyella acidiphila]
MNSCAAHILNTFPWRDPARMALDRDVLVVAPHPDDESLGCGGLLAWAAATQHRPRVLFLTDGEKSHPGSASYPPERLGKVRRKEAVHACATLGMTHHDVTFLGLPDAGLDSLGEEDLAESVAAIRHWLSWSPRALVGVTAMTDAHGDHIAAHRLVKAALAGQQQHRLFAYPVWTWLQSGHSCLWNTYGWRVDIGLYRRQKEAAIACHATQHGQLIVDSPDAFVLPPELLSHVCRGYEVLLDAHF